MPTARPVARWHLKADSLLWLNTGTLRHQLCWIAIVGTEVIRGDAEPRRSDEKETSEQTDLHDLQCPAVVFRLLAFHRQNQVQQHRFKKRRVRTYLVPKLGIRSILPRISVFFFGVLLNLNEKDSRYAREQIKPVSTPLAVVSREIECYKNDEI